MSALLVVPLKKTFAVDIGKPLKNLINSSYNGNNANVIDHSDAINELSNLRNTALHTSGRSCIKQESLEIIYNYYDQLSALESKIPMHELRDVPFKWKSAFERKMFGGQISLTLTSLAYEKACVLFNIAALQSAVAAAQGTYRDDGFKLATKLLQQSAGIFSHLRGVTSFASPQQQQQQQDSTCDLDTDTLQVLSNLMLAQAQEIFVLKAMKHHMKESTVAQLASSCQYLYERVLKGLQKKSLRTIWDKDWIATVARKQFGFHAIAQLYQSLVCHEKRMIGEEIARLQYSVELFNAARQHSGKPNLYEEFETRAQQNLIKSKKDNELIYNAIVPNAKLLPEPNQAQLAVVLPFTTPLSPNSKDLFVHLVPVILHQAIASSDIRKSEIITDEVMKLRDSTELLNKTLVRLNLPAAIEVAVGSTLPRSILNKAKDMRKKGGIGNLRKLIAEQPKSLERNEDILKEITCMLNEESDADERLRAQFNGKWTRTPSEKLTKTIRSNVIKYHEIIHNAVVADKAIHETFEKHAHMMELLSRPTSQLESECPTGSDGNIKNCRSAQQLRKLMDNVEKIKTERDAIESKLKSATIDLKDQFLNACDMSDDSINKIFAPLRKRVNENIFQQKILIEQIQCVYHTFEKECIGRSEYRDAFLSELASAYDAFTTLHRNMKEGTKFYNDLTYLLINFRNKVSNFCMARNAEKFDLIKSIDEKSSTATNLGGEHYGQMNETTSHPQLSSQSVPMPQSFNPYATFTFKKIR